MLKPEHIVPERDPNFHIHYFHAHREQLIYPSDANHCSGPEYFKDWPIDDKSEDTDEDMGQEEDEDEDEAKNEAEQGEVNREQPEQELNAHILSTPELETSTTKTPQDRSRSDAPSPNPRISGQDLFAAGQHHIWI